MDWRYTISLCHWFWETNYLYKWDLSIQDSLKEGWSLTVKWLLETEHEKLTLIWQIARNRIWTILVLWKSQDNSRLSRIIYWLQRSWFEDNISWRYIWFWYWLNNRLLIKLEEYNTRALEVFEQAKNNKLSFGSSSAIIQKVN